MEPGEHEGVSSEAVEGGASGRASGGLFSPALTRWRDIWPLPLLVLATGTFVAGVVMTLMTRPAPVFTPALDDAARLIELGRYEDAIAELNSRVFPYVGREELSPAARARFHALLARALYGGQRELPTPHRVNDENIVQQFLSAERLKNELSPEDIEALARTYLALGELDRARDRVRELNETARKAPLYRALIRAGAGRSRPDHRDLLLTVEEMLEQRGLSEADRVWAMARRSEMQLGLGNRGQAINDLLRELPLLVGRDIEGLGELFVMLGRAYYESEAYREAVRELERADRDAMLPESNPARATARLYLAHVEARQAQDEDQLRSARDRYDDLVHRASKTGAYLPALLGLAETEAALGADEAALEAYGALVAEMRARGEVPEPSIETLTESLLARARSRDSQWRGGGGGGAHLAELALRYAEIAGELTTLEQTPVEVLAMLSRVHESVAMATLALPADSTGPRLQLDDLRTIDPGTLQRAKRHLIRASSYARLHADRFILDDYSVYADSLWRSAMLSDSAGDREQAIDALSTFARTVPDDARQPEARFLLGQMFQSRGEYTVAAGFYEGLIDEQRSSNRTGIGHWADRSIVPLAQCYILDVDDRNDADAMRLLRGAIDGTRGGPDRPEFRQAVLELGNLAFRGGRYAEAIGRYEEVLARGGEHAEDSLIRYRLADASRLLGEEIERRLGEPMSDRDAGLLSEERARHLRRAIELFTGVRDELGRRDPRLLTQVETLSLRNAYFYIGDCAFDLRSYEEAIESYNMARSRYPGDPSVLVALIQIVNAYIELGDWRSARTANERARAFYQSLPAKVWDDPALPLGRREWERWLDSNAKLSEGIAQGG